MRIPHAMEQRSPCATTNEPANGNHWAHVPQLLKPACPRAQAPQLESRPRSRLEKSPCSNQDPEQPKIKKNYFKKKERRRLPWILWPAQLPLTTKMSLGETSKRATVETHMRSNNLLLFQTTKKCQDVWYTAVHIWQHRQTLWRLENPQVPGKVGMRTSHLPGLAATSF